jgi:flagellar biosynthesis protein FlhF
MMKIKKYTAASIPEALNLVRCEMGDDALILGTSRSRGRRSRDGRVEVVAARDHAVQRVESPVDRSRPGGRKGAGPGIKELKDMRKLDTDIVSELSRIETRLKKMLEDLDVPLALRRDSHRPVNRAIVDAGFDPLMLEGKFPGSVLQSDAASDEIVKTLVSRMPVARVEDRILVFVGPSGSGKTTTLLKVARSVFIDNNTRPKVVFFGSDREAPALLKARCKRLGLKFTQISRLDKMARMLKKEKSPILIDTPGISDLGDAEMRFLVETARETPGMGLRLVVDATMDSWNLCAIASCIPHASGLSLVLTKMDEATRIGGAVTASIASGIPVAFVTGGRAVEDGVHVPDAELLSEKIMDAVRSSDVQAAAGRD